MSYKSRTTTPSSYDKNWIHTSKGGKNPCILVSGNSVLPNCVGYAFGRFMEILGKTPKLSRGNAEDWFNFHDGYARGSTPKLGAVICWRKGKAGNGNDGAGHVAIVEKIYSDGSILISQSGYNSARFWTSTIPKGYYLRGYVFQGFIYNPIVSGTSSVSTKSMGGSIELEVSVLRKGSKGEQVKTIQRILYCINGCPDDLEIDGDFGNITEKYVIKFQKNNGLVADAIVGGKTWNALIK